jgi:hypothetical protein
MTRRHEPRSRPGIDADPRSRDAFLAKKRAKVALLDRIETPGGAGHEPGSTETSSDRVSAMRLLAEVDLALSEHRRGRD